MKTAKRVIYSVLSAVLVIGMSPCVSLAETDGAGEDAKVLDMEAYNSTVKEIEQQEGQYKDDSIIVVYKDGATNAQKENTLQSLDAEGSDVISDAEGLDGQVIVNVPVGEDLSVAEAVATAEQQPGVAYAQPNYLYTIPEENMQGYQDAISSEGYSAESVSSAESEVTTMDEVPVDDPFAAVSKDNSSVENQWWLYTVDVFSAWEMVKTEGTVTVAVLDTGINFEHNDLKNNIDTEHAYDAYSDTQLTESPDKEIFAHGTHVAGIIAAEANNALGLAGVSYNAKILPINVFYSYTNAFGYEQAVTDDDILIRAYNYLLSDDDGNGQTVAQETNTKVINMSLGGYGNSDVAFEELINTAQDAGILSVAAGGNGDDFGNPQTQASYPADYDAVVSVVAIDSNDERAYWCDYNEYKDISAPGIDIWSTWYQASNYQCLSGTSMATPYVSACAALLWAADPSLTPDEVKQALYQTADDIGTEGRDNYYGYGKVNPAAALDYLDAVGIRAERTSMVRTTTQTLTPVQHSNAAPVKIWRWSSSDESIARVDKDGVVTAVAPGTVTINVASANNPDIKGSIELTVTDITLPRAITAACSKTEDAIEVYWSSADAAVGYDIYRSTDGENYALAGGVGAVEGQTSYTFVDSNVTAGQDYYYKVQPIGSLDNEPVTGVMSNSVKVYYSNRVALWSVITEMNTALNETKVSSNGNDVQTDYMWVTQETADNLSDAIDKAKNGYYTIGLTQEEVDALVTEMQGELDTFNAARQKAKRFVAASDWSALDNSIAAAQESLGSVAVAASAEDVPNGNQWVTQADFDALQAAIDAATATRNSSTTSQIMADNAAETLDDAVAEFEAKIQTGTGKVDVSELTKETVAANILAGSMNVSEDGTDIDICDQWVPKDESDDLAAAIDAANEVLNSESPTQADVDDALANLKAAAGAFESAETNGSANGGLIRIAGSSRYETSAAISSTGFTTCEHAVVATGSSYPDALCASSVAGLYDCPIILTEPDALSATAKTELERLGVKDVTIVGGKSAVSQDVEDGITDMGISVERIAGSGRSQTSLAAYQKVASTLGSANTVIIATGQNYADALSVSPLAYSSEIPIVLAVDGQLPDDVASALRSAGVENVIVVGGTGAVSDDVASQLELSGTYTRLSGSDRYTTSKAIAEYEISNGFSPTSVVVATGANFPDALSGAALAGSDNSVILLANPVTPSAKDALAFVKEQAENIKRVYTLGGTSSVSDLQANEFWKVVTRAQSK
ncbi:MAG: S8 family serine peptidase [Coriobacteriales bacterium]